MIAKSVQFISISFIIRISLAVDVKVWNKDTRLDSGRNWREGVVPCAKDRIIFPEDFAGVVTIPQSFAASEMILPMNGKLVFEGKARFNLVDKTDEFPCIGKDVFFKPNVDSWYDPSNWNITSDRAYPITSPRRNSAVPHAFQIPCMTDDVSFPSTFKAQSLYPVPKVSKLTINGMVFDQESFDELVSSGDLLFPGTPSLQITRAQCGEPAGCACENQLFLDEICKFVQPCMDVPCNDPIQVTGHCCPICASRITAKYDTRFNMNRLLQIHATHHERSVFKNVDSYASVLSDSEIQLVYVESPERSGDMVAYQLADTVYSILEEDNNAYGIKSIKIEKSVMWKSGWRADAISSNGLSSASTAVIVVFIFVVIGIVGFVYFYRKTQIPGFSFARFDLRGDKIELELGTTPHDELEPGDSFSGNIPPESGTRSFDNPIYSSSDALHRPSEDENTNGASIEDVVENPTYLMFAEEQIEKNQ